MKEKVFEGIELMNLHSAIQSASKGEWLGKVWMNAMLLWQLFPSLQMTSPVG
jgi:hypothetical protein